MPNDKPRRIEPQYESESVSGAWVKEWEKYADRLERDLEEALNVQIHKVEGPDGGVVAAPCQISGCQLARPSLATQVDEWERNYEFQHDHGNKYATAYHDLLAFVRQLAAPLSPRATLEGTITEVVGADGKGVAAPCAIDGCALMRGEAVQSHTEQQDGDLFSRTMLHASQIVDDMETAWHDSNEEHSGHYMDAASRIAATLRERAKHPAPRSTPAPSKHGLTCPKDGMWCVQEICRERGCKETSRSSATPQEDDHSLEAAYARFEGNPPSSTATQEHPCALECQRHEHKGYPRCVDANQCDHKEIQMKETPESIFENLCDELKVQMDPALYEAVRVFAARLSATGEKIK